MMSFKAWLTWYKAQSWHFKWFILLVILRPIIDNFYFLKDVSPLISPLYIAGILTPILVILSFISNGFPSKQRAPFIDFLVGFWGLVVLFNVAVFLLNEYSMKTLGESIKYITPLLLFFYLRHVLRSKTDLHGLLKTFMLSLYFPVLIFFYEMLFGGINPEALSAGRGGGTRIQGAYADIMNYAIYIVSGLLISCYSFLLKMQLRKIRMADYLKLGLVVAIVIVGLSSVKQVSSWGACIGLMSVFGLFAITKKETLLIALLLMPIILFTGRVIYDKQVGKLVEKEVKVIEGNSHVDRSFNGRMSRWRKYFESWDEMPTAVVFIGVATSGFDEVANMLGGGMHSDYVRLLFLTGIIGLFCYLLIFLFLSIKAQSFKAPEKFLVWATVVAVMLHSVSTTPLLYMSYVYIIMTVFAFASLPNRSIRG